MVSETCAVAMKGITKEFPGVLANDRVDFELKEGEIHGLLGENGAGKTTLMNILYGLDKPDAGEIFVFGQRREIRSPRHALTLGIGMVHQHFMPVKRFKVASNIVLALREKTGWRMDETKAIALVERFCADMAYFKVDARARVDELPVGIQQRVEILKALYRGAKVLILDEPTAVLTPQETDELFGILRSLQARGLSIIFISHKLAEVMALTQRVTVMRGGRVVGTRMTAETTPAELARMMVGREVIFDLERTPSRAQEVVLSVRDLVVEGDQRLTAVRGVSFDVRRGEIVGIAGVDGNGQRELAEAIAGLRKVTRGDVLLNGKDIAGLGARAFIDSGGAYIPDDRHEMGLVLDFTLAENFILGTNCRPPFSRHGILNLVVLAGAVSKARAPASECVPYSRR
ncbi:MAG TPA: ABC transporter ATP-binding protein [Firmicutes bacterium]|nr:ABC transporter ATP-binding protein [Bacillota bacterium]